MINMENSELDSSELGTHSYWKQAYSDELSNFDNHGDLGDIWFGQDSLIRVINWICESNVDKNKAILDLGSGNGYTLMELAREGFTNLLGVDYCYEAIQLSEKVCKEEFPNIKFKVFDIIEDEIAKLDRKFDLIHDKGTYDAICLNPDDPKKKRLKYVKQVFDMLQDDGIYIITSCNWTERELIEHFCENFKLKCVIPTPQFKFGGKVGSVVSSVVFVKSNK